MAAQLVSPNRVACDNQRMGWGSALQAEWRAWLAAWKGNAQNPLVHYFRLARQRRIAKIPGWRRRLPYLIVGTALLAGVAIPVIVEMAATGFNWSTDDFTILSVATFLGLLSALFLVYMLTGIFDTAISVMSLLGQPGLRVRGRVLDDMAAITLLGDHEITAAVIRIYWPRLIWISLLGAVLLWLWMAFMTLLEAVYSASYQLMLTVLAFGPLTVGAVAMPGVLAGLIYILWLISAGRELGNAFYASVAGVIVALAHLVTTPLATGVCLWIVSELSTFGAVQGPAESTMLPALIMSILLIAGFALALYISEQWAGLRPFALIIAPFLIPAGAVLIVLVRELFSVYLYTDIWAFEYVAVWRAFSLANAAISLPPPCFGSWHMEATSQIPLEWFRYPVLIASQLLLAATALHFTRRAVQLRRRNFE